MGLDITAYCKISPAPQAEVDEDGSPKDWKNYAHLHPAVLKWTEENWPGHSGGIIAGVYSFADAHSFRAGSYSGYNEWRSWLAKISGWGSAEQCWESGKKEGPFFELIHFADNEGVIGPKVAAKLLADFREFEAQAKRMGDSWEFDRYQQWTKACELAADGGCIDFH